jgi:transcriptional regulator with XRE-family HTH domain
MRHAGRKLKEARERLSLRYRDVVAASLRIAERRGSREFAVGLSRLADIENKDVVPSLQRIYTLCAIYRLRLPQVLSWYGVDAADLEADALSVDIPSTHLLPLEASGDGMVAIPGFMQSEFDSRRTSLLTRFVQSWGAAPLALLKGLERTRYQYGLIGTEDWFMHPILAPGSLVLIDPSRKRIAGGGWATELERPIYFFELHDGFACGWASLNDKQLLLQPHPVSRCAARSYLFGEEIEVLGRVAGMATRLDQGTRRRARS